MFLLLFKMDFLKKGLQQVVRREKDCVLFAGFWFLIGLFRKMIFIIFLESQQCEKVNARYLRRFTYPARYLMLLHHETYGGGSKKNEQNTIFFTLLHSIVLVLSGNDHFLM